MAMKKTPVWRYGAIAAIWAAVVFWSVRSIMTQELGGILAALAFGAIASMLITGYSSSDVKKL